MIIVSVLYPRSSESRFDYDYYLQKHIPLVRSRWDAMGLLSVDLMRGASTLDGSGCTFELIGMLTFRSIGDMQAALTSFGTEILADIVNFTNAQPVVQVNEPIPS